MQTKGLAVFQGAVDVLIESGGDVVVAQRQSPSVWSFQTIGLPGYGNALVGDSLGGVYLFRYQYFAAKNNYHLYRNYRTPSTTSYAGNGGYYGHGSLLGFTVDPQDRPHVFYHLAGQPTVPPEPRTEHYAYQELANGIWENPSIAALGNGLHHVSLAGDAAGRMHMLFASDATPTLKYANRSATAPWAVSPLTVAKDTSAVVVDAQDTLHAIVKNNSGLHHLVRTSQGSWSSGPSAGVPSNIAIRRRSLMLAPNGDLHLVYRLGRGHVGRSRLAPGANSWQSWIVAASNADGPGTHPGPIPYGTMASDGSLHLSYELPAGVGVAYTKIPCP